MSVNKKNIKLLSKIELIDNQSKSLITTLDIPLHMSVISYLLMGRSKANGRKTETILAKFSTIS